jgi:hypothetical protein
VISLQRIRRNDRYLTAYPEKPYLGKLEEHIMRKTRLFSALMTAALGALFVFAASAETAAQGRYTDRYSRAQVDDIIRRLEDSGDEFRRDFENELNRSNLSNSQRNAYRRQVETFENSTDRLRSTFDNSDTWWNARSQVQNVVANSRPLNTTMNGILFRRNIERQWNRLRSDINTLADTYDLPGIAGGGWTGGPGGGGWDGGGGGNATRPPAWARGTWYWMQGYGRTMNIDNNGRVTLYNQGRTSYGTWNRNTIFVDGITSRVVRSGNNLRTENSVTGEISDYSRSETGTGPGWGGGGGGNISRPPSWARGTWYWVEGPARRMTIDNDGRITLYNQGRTSFGTYYEGTITIDGLVSTVSRFGNRIRTVNQATGEISEYRR